MRSRCYQEVMHFPSTIVGHECCRRFSTRVTEHNADLPVDIAVFSKAMTMVFVRQGQGATPS